MLTCNCGSTDFIAFKLGGRLFNVIPKNKSVWFRGDGYEPEVWVCTECRQLSFTLKEEDMQKVIHQKED